jgi:hypothetical protein
MAVTWHISGIGEDTGVGPELELTRHPRRPGAMTIWAGLPFRFVHEPAAGLRHHCGLVR